ncbi:hypothetical protein [Flavobacterium chungangense]|uniref:Cell wall anchor protein n=1 Tax=Flavobacterium chungangense TaxID=554283 RepID=A0A6V6Z4V1_9FLAO|nr:hypothetical protein [Flavobacterium chungangense]CAD0006675.1 hypothetical protein FLACHUCJ7_02966 [Flavobacterium chungangense]
MKNNFTMLFFSVLFFNITLNAQISSGAGGSILPNNPTSNNNMGIGVNNPKAKLEIEGFPTINRTYTFLDHGDSFDKSVLLNIGTIRSTSGSRLLTFSDVPPSNIVPNGQTMLAIEDRNDANRLRHHATANGPSLFTLSDKTQTAVFQMYEDGLNAFFDLPKPGSYLTVGGIAVWPIAHNFWVKTGTSKFDHDVFIDTNLCIGTSSFTDGSETYRLSVKGKVRAEEVKVYNTWADYVFAKNYDLKPLTKVEEYIAQNGHLPNVPSAKEITEKGLELGEMAKIQQEKIEELTLYLIQQNKEIEELKSQMKLLLAAQKK